MLRNLGIIVFVMLVLFVSWPFIVEAAKAFYKKVRK